MAKKSDMSRRDFIWLGAAWATFTGALTLAGAAVTRFLFPNVLFEPPSQFKAGFPSEYTVGKVDLRWKKKYGVWLVRDVDVNRGEGFYALSTVCTHLGCTPNWLDAEQKFKCPCHGSGFRRSGVHFEGPAPRPLERYRVAFSDDGQILVDKSMKFQQEKGEWSKADAFLALA
jgi:cytochrome b6-f complex iron-sulfur subunit